MGYETILLFVTNHEAKNKSGKCVGFCHIEASVEMSKVTYNKIGQLHTKTKLEGDKENKLQEEVKEYEEMHKSMFTLEGEWTDAMLDLTETQRKKESDKLHKLQNNLDEKLPYVYWENGNNQSYTDRYGDLLIVVDLIDLKNAILQDQASDIANGETPYRRYNMALKMIEAFQGEGWGHEVIKVVMWGH